MSKTRTIELKISDRAMYIIIALLMTVVFMECVF